jgi:hypothetical protein
MAQAHTSFVVKEAVASKTFYATLNVGHGCSDESDKHVDTYKLVLDIPAQLSELSNASIRPMDAEWGKASIIRNAEGVITQVAWTKPEGTYPRSGDDAQDSWGYRASLNVRMPDAPFTKVVFPAATQYCMKEDGTEFSKAWDGDSAPTITLLPAHISGWNQFVAPADMDVEAIKDFFSGALIVWVGDAAYSSNAITDSAITSKLTSISKDADIWVKY